MSDRPMHTVPGAFEALVKIYAEAERLLDLGAFEDAEHKLDEGLAIDDHFRQRYVTMYALRAFARQRLGRWAEAASDYDRALAMEPPIHHAQYHFQRGMCLSRLPGRDDDALADYGRAIALDPEQPGPFHLRGKLRIDVRGELAAGVADLDRALALAPHPGALQLRAYAHLVLGHEEQAVADARASQALRSDAYNHYLVATAFVRLRCDVEAYAEIARTLELDRAYQETFATDPEFDRLRDHAEFARLVRKTS